MSSQPETVSQIELARRIGVRSRQIRELVESGLPRAFNGTKPVYPWPESLHWYIGFVTRNAQTETSSKKEKRDALELRRREAEVRLAELELAKLEGHMVTIDYMEQQLGGMLLRLRAKLLNLPGKWSPAMVGLRTIAEAQARLEPAIAEAMESLTETGEDPELDEADDDN